MRSFAPIASAATITILSVSLIVSTISFGLTISKQAKAITAQQDAIDALKKQVEAEQLMSRLALDMAQQRKLLVDRYRSDAVPLASPDAPGRWNGNSTVPSAR